jgi:purine nucleosidase
MIKETGKYIFLIVLLFAACNVQKEPQLSDKHAIPIIFDTDMESDVDDVGALAMLHALADFGETEILGVMVCAENPWSALCADRINTYFKRENLPIGQLKRPGVNRESRYAQQVAEEFPGKLQSANDAPDAVDLYRKLLSAQPDNSVIILTVGYLTNLRDLLTTGPDEHSKLNGKELIRQKVRLWVCMGGLFPSGREANIRWDTKASIEAINNWPTEIIFSGWEIGNMDTGSQIRDLPESNPIRRAYESFGRIPHKNWDQVATLYAVRGLDNGPAADYWELSNPGRIVIDSSDGSNIWEDDPNGTHRYLIQVGSDEEIAREIDALMMYIPGQSI